MRVPALAAAGVLILALAVALGHGLGSAGADGVSAASLRDNLELRDRVRALEAEVAYLLERDTAVSAYVLANAERADNLDAIADLAFERGFTKRAIPANSREAIIDGLRTLAEDLRRGLPVVTDDQRELLALRERVLQRARSRARPEGQPDGE